ncbi:MAG: mycofactocin-coupled SDR family oxidoreductase [Actinomycetota bacterium]
MTTERARDPRVAIVTGAARGIGAAVVDGLAGAGWTVVAVDRCADVEGVAYPMAQTADLEAVAARWPGQVDPVVADVRDAGALAALVAASERDHGGLDAAVAAAAVIIGGKALWDEPPQTLETMWDINVRGTWNLAAAAVPALLRRPQPRSGRFVAVASAAGHRGLWHLAAYISAKHAVVGVVLGLATDLRGTGVTANAVSPGSTRTPMLSATAALYGLEDPEELSHHQLVERLLEPAEVAAAICWLCSEQASAMTGSVLHADGGLTT